MAAAVGVRLVVEQPLKSLTTNIRGSQVMIEAAPRPDLVAP
jgi:UDP-glucose 4-epimerase